MAVLTREDVINDSSVHGGRFARELSDLTDAWLAGLFAQATAGVGMRTALVAVGGYGRAELAPGSDLDVLLLYDGKRLPATVTETLWYPVWDAKLKLGHAVRSVKEALRLASGDLDTATALLSVRHVAGDPALTASLADGARAQWRKRSRSWLDRVRRGVDERHAQHGEVAFLLEPNLKEGRGGLRDVHALSWAALATDDLLAEGDEQALREAYEVLLATRVELHRVTGRPGDVLALQDQDAVAARLRFADADLLMAAVSAAARTISWISDEAWYRVRVAGASSAGGRDGSRPSPLVSAHGSARSAWTTTPTRRVTRPCSSAWPRPQPASGCTSTGAPSSGWRPRCRRGPIRGRPGPATSWSPCCWKATTPSPSSSRWTNGT